MLPFVLRYGLYASALICTISLIMWNTFSSIDDAMSYGMIVGYTSMILSMLMVYFGIKRYRDSTLDGKITFLRALGCGCLIALIASVCYVIAWEITMITTLPNFIHDYAAATIRQLEQAHASDAEIAATKISMQEMVTSYANPLMRYAYTFMEIAPVGLLASLISAAVVSRKGASIP